MKQFSFLFWAFALLPLIVKADDADFTTAFAEQQAKPGRSSKPHELPADLPRYACKVGRGSGVNLRQGVLTCWHCVSDAVAKGKSIDVECDGEKGVGIVALRDIENDLALLTVTWKQTHASPAIATEEAREKESVWSAGRTRDGTIGVDRYRILAAAWSHTGNTFYTDNAFIGGQSGSGMFNVNGELIGIAKATELTNEPYRGMSTGIGAIAQLLARHTPVAARRSVTIYIKPHCKPGDAVCTRCVQQTELVGTGDRRVAITVSTEPIPAHIADRVKLYPVIVWEKNEQTYWIAGPGIYTLDQIVEAMQ